MRFLEHNVFFSVAHMSVCFLFAVGFFLFFLFFFFDLFAFFFFADARAQILNKP